MLDPRNSHVDNTTFPLFDPFRTINNNNNNNSNSSRHLLDKAKRQTPDRHDEEVGFELKLLETGKDEDDESGIQSPPLWKNSNNNNSPVVHPLSPNSRRREAIVKGQKELMEMVRSLPESCYELSLKDLVEHNPRPPQTQNQQEYDDDDDKIQSNRHGGSKKFDKKRGYGMESNNNNKNKGMLLKMVFPVGNRSSTRKSMVLLNSSSSKGSSKLLVDGNGGGNSSNKFWWKTDSISSHSRTSSSNSNTNSTTSTCSRERRTMLPNCMACFPSSKNLSAE